MITDGIYVNDVCFQQGASACHTSHATINLLRLMFDGHLISRNITNWPPRSSDLTPFDYFLCGAVKEKHYADKPETIEHLKANIRNAIAEIRCTKIRPIK